jgi:hypothetical protein
MSETIWRLMSLGQEKMPNAIGINKFNYDPCAKHSNAAPEGAKVKEASTKDVEAAPAEQDLNLALDPKRGK